MLEAISNIGIVEWVYYFFAVSTLVGALGTILAKNPIHSVIYLVATFFSLSGIYVLLNAQFLAVVNIIVYAGAIMVLFLFVLMFLNLRKENNELNNRPMVIAAVISGGLLAILMVGVLRKATMLPVDMQNFSSKTGLVETLGDLLYKHYMLPFELVSILFLAAIAGAILLAKREKGTGHI